MSLMSRGLAIASVGSSCQVAHQLTRAASSTFSALDLELVGMPWDWRIAGPADVAACVRENRPYPASAAEIELKAGRVWWPARQTWFWHEKMAELAHFPRFSEKQAHLWANWGKISKVDRQVFIGANTQNNLREKRDEVGGIEVEVRLEDVFELAAALRGAFKRAELHWVTRNGLVSDLGRYGFKRFTQREHVVTVGEDRVHLHLLEPDRTSWQGAPDQWDRILDRIIRAKTPAKVSKAK